MPIRAAGIRASVNWRREECRGVTSGVGEITTVPSENVVGIFRVGPNTRSAPPVQITRRTSGAPFQPLQTIRIGAAPELLRGPIFLAFILDALYVRRTQWPDFRIARRWH